METIVSERIRTLITERKLIPTDIATLGDTDDLYEAGLTSFASVQLMLALEEAFDIEFPEKMLTRRTFASIAAIEQSIAEILAEQQA